MLKKTVKYLDFNGVEKTEDFYFNLTKAEVVDLENSTSGGMAEKIKLIAASNNVPDIIQVFRSIVRLAYGQKTADGRFEKSPEIVEKFLSTKAYSDIYYELVTHPEDLAKFVEGLLPKDDPS